MRINIELKSSLHAHKWFSMAFVLLILFLLYTTIFSTGILLIFTLHREQWLLDRPLTRIDCVFFEWRKFGEVPFSLFLILLLSTACVWLGYRRRVLPYLVILMLLCVGSEAVGKHLFPQPVPRSLEIGMRSLGCPQIWHKPLQELLVTLGFWWQAPAAPKQRIRNEHLASMTPLTFIGEYIDYSYPSGHAIRWMFLGLIVGWLVWRHIRYRLLRFLLLGFALAIAFGGGFLMYFIGSHLFSDLVAGYLLGASTAFCAIGILLKNETTKMRHNAE